MASGSHRSGSNPSSSRGTWWDVVEIVEEDRDGKRYRVRWAGKDPKTGKPWPLEWVSNSQCSPDLIKDWEKKKAKGKKQESLASTSGSKSYPVGSKRPSENRDVVNTSEPPVFSTNRKRKHSTPSGSLDHTDEDSAPSRRKRLATAVESTPSDGHGGQSTAPSHAPPNKKDRHATTGDLPFHPPLEEIEDWVRTPNAKFGPPKRKRTTGERRDPPKEGRIDNAVPAKTPVPRPTPLPSLSQPLSLTESQIVALREEEEEGSQSQSQSTLNQPSGTINDSATSDPLLPTMKDAKNDKRPTNSNGNNGRGLEHSGQGAHPQSNVPNPIKQVLGVTNDPPGYPQVKSMQGEGVNTEPHIPVFNTNPSASAGSSKSPPTEKSVKIGPPRIWNSLPSASANSPSKSPQVEKSMQGEGVNTEPHIPVFDPNPSASADFSKSPPTEMSVKVGPPRIWKSGPGSIKQPNSSRSKSPPSGSGTLAKRRAFEARIRLDELRFAGKRFRNIAAKSYPALETSQSSEQPSPHEIFKRVMDGIESPNSSQVTHLGNSANEISSNASPGGNIRPDPSKSQEGLVTNKSGQDAKMGSISRIGGVLAPNSEEEVPPTASNSTQSQSHDTLPYTPLDSQLAAALDLLHKKSEEISELRIQVNVLRMGSTEHTSNGALRGKKATDYLATEVQTDRDNEAHKDWDLERTRWVEEKLALQGEAEALRGEKARALADIDFFRAQYQKASDFASSTRLENEELSARAALAESQATNGVTLVRATFEGRVAKLEAEVQKYKALSEMLTERARRTDDGVRFRAALVPEFQREFGQLDGRFKELEAELEETKDELFDEKRANSKLRRRMARLESKEQEQAADVGRSTKQEQDHTLWSDEKDDGDYNPVRSPSLSPRGWSDGSSPQPQLQKGHSPHNEDNAGPADGEIEELGSFGLGESAQSSNDDMVYLCRWRPGEPAGNCDAVVNTKEELHEHMLSHHLTCH